MLPATRRETPKAARPTPMRRVGDREIVAVCLRQPDLLTAPLRLQESVLFLRRNCRVARVEPTDTVAM